MVKDFISGAKSVASARGVGAVVATLVIFAALAYFGITAQGLAASAKQRVGA